MHILIFDIGFQEKVKNYFLFSAIFAYLFTFYPKNPKRPNRQSANKANFVAFCICFQKNIPLQNPPGGGRGGVYGSSRSISAFQTLLSILTQMKPNNTYRYTWLYSLATHSAIMWDMWDYKTLSASSSNLASPIMSEEEARQIRDPCVTYFCPTLWRIYSKSDAYLSVTNLWSFYHKATLMI